MHTATATTITRRKRDEGPGEGKEKDYNASWAAKVKRSLSSTNLVVEPQQLSKHKKRSSSSSPPPRRTRPHADKPKAENLEGHKQSYIVHQHVKNSPLDAEEADSQNYRGILNLGGLILFVTNMRLIIENLLKYGLLLKFDGSLWHMWKAGPCIATLFALNIFIGISFLLERWGAHRGRSIREGKASGKRRENKIERLEKKLSIAHALNITCMCALPIIISELTNADPMSAFGLLFVTITLMMKLISWALTNKEIRTAYLKPGAKPPTTKISTPHGTTYPQNINLNNLYYFVFAPTLCYQMEYPRTPRIRWLKLAVLFGKWIFLNGLIAFLVEQYVVPILQNSIEPLDKMQWGRILERLLKLSIPNLYIWLLFFYSFFHVWLNMLAELLRFGDREFYQDWWNSTTFSEYWRTWNLPVHNWLLRHVYYPLRRSGSGPMQAAFFIFFLSGVGHEVLVSFPCHTFQLWVLGSFMAQIPLIYVTRTFMKGTKWGNLMFWFSFCILGQPLCILLYTHLVYKRYAFLYW